MNSKDTEYGVLWTYLKNGNKGKRISLNNQEDFTIGTSLDAKIRIKIDDLNILGIHCNLKVDDNGCALLINKGAIKPVEVNGRKIFKQVYLKNGDTIIVGKKKFQYENENLDEKILENVAMKKKKIFQTPRRKTAHFVSQVATTSSLQPSRIIEEEEIPQRTKINLSRNTPSRLNASTSKLNKSKSVLKTPRNESSMSTNKFSVSKKEVKTPLSKTNISIKEKSTSKINFSKTCEEENDARRSPRTPVNELASDLIDFNTPVNNTSVVELETPPVASPSSQKKARLSKRKSASMSIVDLVDTPNGIKPSTAKKNLSASVICVDTPTKATFDKSDLSFKTPNAPVSSLRKKLLQTNSVSRVNLRHCLDSVHSSPDFKSRHSSTPVQASRSIIKNKSNIESPAPLEKSRKSLRFAESDVSSTSMDLSFKNPVGSTPLVESKEPKSLIANIQLEEILEISSGMSSSLKSKKSRSNLFDDLHLTEDDETTMGMDTNLSMSRRSNKTTSQDSTLAIPLEASNVKNASRLSTSTSGNTSRRYSRRSIKEASMNDNNDSTFVKSMNNTSRRKSFINPEVTLENDDEENENSVSKKYSRKSTLLNKDKSVVEESDNEDNETMSTSGNTSRRYSQRSIKEASMNENNVSTFDMNNTSRRKSFINQEVTLDEEETKNSVSKRYSRKSTFLNKDKSVVEESDNEDNETMSKRYSQRSTLSIKDESAHDNEEENKNSESKRYSRRSTLSFKDNSIEESDNKDDETVSKRYSRRSTLLLKGNSANDLSLETEEHKLAEESIDFDDLNSSDFIKQKGSKSLIFNNDQSNSSQVCNRRKTMTHIESKPENSNKVSPKSRQPLKSSQSVQNLNNSDNFKTRRRTVAVVNVKTPSFSPITEKRGVKRSRSSVNSSDFLDHKRAREMNSFCSDAYEESRISRMQSMFADISFPTSLDTSKESGLNISKTSRKSNKSMRDDLNYLSPTLKEASILSETSRKSLQKSIAKNNIEDDECNEEKDASILSEVSTKSVRKSTIANNTEDDEQNKDNLNISSISRRSARITKEEASQNDLKLDESTGDVLQNVNEPENNLSNVSGVKRSLRTSKVAKSPELQGIKKLLKTPKVPKSPKLQGVKKLLKTPKVNKGPKNDLSNVAGLKKLLATPKVNKGPNNDLSNVAGVKKLLATPKVNKGPNNDLSNVAGVKKLLATPKVNKGPKNDLSNVAGVKKLLATPKVNKGPNNDLSNVAGVKKLLATPKVDKGPNNDLSNVAGVKKLLSTPKVDKGPNNDLSNVAGVKKLLATPKEQKEPLNDLTDVRGVKKIMAERKIQNEPVNDLSDLRGVKQILGTPKERKEPKNDLSDLRGVRKMFVKQRSPLNDLTNPVGLRRLMKSPKTRNEDPEISFTGVSELFDIPSKDQLFDELIGKQPSPKLKTYSKKPSPNKVKLWVEEQNQLLQNSEITEPATSSEVTEVESNQNNRKRKVVDIEDKPQENVLPDTPAKSTRSRKRTKQDEATPVQVEKKVTRARRGKATNVEVQDEDAEKQETKKTTRGRRAKAVDIENENNDNVTEENNQEQIENATVGNKKGDTPLLHVEKKATRARRGKVVEAENNDNDTENNKEQIENATVEENKKVDTPLVQVEKKTTRARRGKAVEAENNDNDTENNKEQIENATVEESKPVEMKTTRSRRGKAATEVEENNDKNDIAENVTENKKTTRGRGKAKVVEEEIKNTMPDIEEKKPAKRGRGKGKVVDQQKEPEDAQANSNEEEEKKQPVKRGRGKKVEDKKEDESVPVEEKPTRRGRGKKQANEETSDKEEAKEPDVEEKAGKRGRTTKRGIPETDDKENLPKTRTRTKKIKLEEDSAKTEVVATPEKKTRVRQLKVHFEDHLMSPSTPEKPKIEEPVKKSTRRRK